MALVVIHLCILMTNWTILNNAQSKMTDDAKTVNLLGQMRGGIQRASKFFLYDLSAEKSSRMIEEFEKHLEVTRTLMYQDFNEHYAFSEKLIHDWNTFKEMEAQCRKIRTKECLEELLITSEILWHDADKLVGMVQNSSEQKLKELNRIYIIIVFEVVLLVVLIFVIYRLVNRTLGDSQEQMEKYIDITDKYVITSQTDLKGVITYASEAFCQISGYTKEELIGQNHNIVNHPDMSRELFRELWETIRAGKSWSGEIKNRKKDGTHYWVKSNISPLYEHGEHIGYMAVRIDITDKKQLEIISATDRLTQVYNRAKLDDEFSHEIKRAKRYQQPLAVIMLDIDHFKSVNDEYGHLVGDSVLKEMAKILRTNIRNTDIPGRWGGEEFLILCPETTLEGAVTLAENLRQKISSFSFDTVGHKTVSMGVSLYRKGESEDELVKRADDAMYQAKGSGRNQVVTLERTDSTD